MNRDVSMYIALESERSPVEGAPSSTPLQGTRDLALNVCSVTLLLNHIQVPSGKLS